MRQTVFRLSQHALIKLIIFCYVLPRFQKKIDTYYAYCPLLGTAEIAKGKAFSDAAAGEQ